VQRYGSEVPTLAKNARMGHPQSWWWCPESPQNPHSAVVKMRDGKDGAPGFLPKAARNGAPEERRSEWMCVGRAESAGEIPRPAGESAGLRDDVDEGWEKISFAGKVG